MEAPQKAHALVGALKACASHKKEEMLEELLDLDIIWHVACYVLTDSGRMFVQSKKKEWFGKKVSIGDGRFQSFGGCKYEKENCFFFIVCFLLTNTIVIRTVFTE
jgi:hypothetical protein